MGERATENPSGRERLIRRLEVATNAAVLLMASLVLNVLAWSYMAPEPRPQFTSGMHKGKRLEQLADLNNSASLHTLLIAISPECISCEASVPFYKRLAGGVEENRTTNVRALFTGREGAMREFLSRHKLSLDVVPSVNFAANGIEVTPTIILIDANGAVLNFWAGKLSEESERQILSVMSGAHNSD